MAADTIKVTTKEMTIDGTSYVMNAADGSVKLGDALEVADKTITDAGANVFVVANKNPVGTYTGGTNIVGMDTDDLTNDSIASGGNELLTNNGRGYVKTAAKAGAFVGAQVSAILNNATVTVALAATGNDEVLNDNTNYLIPVGFGVKLEINAGTVAIGDNDEVGGTKFGLNTTGNTGVTSANCTVVTTTPLPTGVALTAADKALVTVTFTAAATDPVVVVSLLPAAVGSGS